MSKEKTESETGKTSLACEAGDQTIHENDAEDEMPSDAQAEFSEHYRKLPVWKQVILLILFLGGMTAVIMLINFIVEFGAELIKAMLQ